MAKEKATDKKLSQIEGDKAASADVSREIEGDKTGKKELKSVDPGKMRIKVYSPYQVYFDEQGTSISAINDTGPFDILPKHHRFLTLLNPCELMIMTEKGEEKIKISRGIMYVKEDRVTVFLDV